MIDSDVIAKKSIDTKMLYESMVFFLVWQYWTLGWTTQGGSTLNVVLTHKT